jgi:hypothetical protein
MPATNVRQPRTNFCDVFPHHSLDWNKVVFASASTCARHGLADTVHVYMRRRSKGIPANAVRSFIVS